jgi:preprotein translocase subunit SecE
LTYTIVVLVFVSIMIAIVSVLDLAFGWAVFEVFG